MAKTAEGIEFYLVQVSPNDPALTSRQLATDLESVIRRGDGVFVDDGKVYIVLAAEVPGAAIATKRLMRTLKKKELHVKVRLLPEPFAPRLWKVSSRVISGGVPVAGRKKKALEWEG